MKTLAITGATGVVGSRALQHLLAHAEVGRLVALGRRAPSVEHPKLVSKVVNLLDVTAMAAEIPEDVSVAVCCLGTTMKQAGSKEAFRAVDLDAVVAFAKAALQKGAQRFVVVSAIGANRRSSNFYTRTKGEAEEALAGLGYPQLTVLRPSLIDDQGARADHRVAEKLALPLARAFFSVIGRTRKYAPIPADVIARALVRLCFDDTAEKHRTVESDRLHLLGG